MISNHLAVAGSTIPPRTRCIDRRAQPLAEKIPVASSIPLQRAPCDLQLPCDPIKNTVVGQVCGGWMRMTTRGENCQGDRGREVIGPWSRVGRVE